MISDRYYFFLDAYDRLGRHLFADTWTGREIHAKELQSPAIITAERAPLAAALETLDQRIKALENERRRSVKEADISRIGEETAQAFKKRGTTQSQLQGMYEPDDRYIASYEAWRRRERTKATLIDGLKSAKIEARAYEGLTVPNHLWHGGTPHFKFSIELSTAWLPSNVSANKRVPLLVPVPEFDAWLSMVIPEVDSGAHNPTNECRRYLRALNNSGKKDKTKPEIKKEAMNKFFGLSAFEFNRIWADEMGPGWKKKGRPVKVKK